MKALAVVCSFGLGILGLTSGLEANVLQAPVLAPQETGISKKDLKTLLAAKISDTTIIAYIRSHAPAPKLSAEDLVELKDAGASSEVLAAMVEASSAKAPPANSGNYTAPSYSYDPSVPYGTTSSYYAYDDAYPYYPYGYAYPYYPYYPYYGFGFGVSVGIHDHHHHDQFHHVDNHAGHVGVHDYRGGQVPHGTVHGGTGSGGGAHGGGGHGGGGGHH